MPAIAAFALCFLLLWLADSPATDKGRQRVRWLIWAAPMLLLAGNRFNGADWINYKRAFETLSGEVSALDGVLASPFEWLFSLLLWAIGQTGLPYEAVVAVIGVFNALALTHIIRQLAPDFPARTMALVLLVEGWTLYHEQLRQSVAVTLGLLSLLAAHRGSWLRTAVLWIAATGFHSSAVIAPIWLLLMRQVRRSDNQPMRLTQVLMLGAVAFAVIAGGLTLLRQGLLPIAGLDRLQTKLELYQEHDVFGGALFTAGMVAYALGFLVLMAVRRRVVARGDFWLSFAWTAAILWTVLGPALRTQAILIRFEHYLLIFMPLALGLLLQRDDERGWGRRARTLVFCVFAATFPLRVFLHPENLVWSLDYQNTVVFNALSIELEDADLREALICANLALFDNDFCGREPTN